MSRACFGAAPGITALSWRHWRLHGLDVPQPDAPLRQSSLFFAAILPFVDGIRQIADGRSSGSGSVCPTVGHAMPYSIRLTAREEKLLEAASRKSARSKSSLVRQGIREVCLKVVAPLPNAYEAGRGLFGAGRLARPPRDPLKRAIAEKLRVKHGRLG